MSCIGQEKQDDGEQKKMRRRAQQTQHRVTLAALFEALKNVVCPPSQSSQNCEDSSNKNNPAKWKILDHAMGFLLEKEAYLSKLLSLKEVYLDDDGGLNNLEDVREQYRSLYSEHFLDTRIHSCRACAPDVDEDHERSEGDSTDEETDELPQSQSSGSSVPNIQEFEGETLELLLHSGVIAPDQTGLSVVSEAISGLWNSLSPEWKAETQQHVIDQSSQISTLHLTSLNPSSSHAIEEELLLQDAYDVVQRDMNAASVNSESHRPAVLQNSDYEKLRQIYHDISGFIRSHMAEDQKIPQLARAEDLSQVAEYAENLLRCSESFDDDF